MLLAQPLATFVGVRVFARKACIGAARRATAYEASRLVVQRVGQDLFRSALLDYWQGRCCITGLDIPVLLRASHIKPWAACTSDDERPDVFNGLLLAPHLDALFDAGLMTVDETGSICLSSSIGAAARTSLAVLQPLRVDGLRPEHLKYLKHHREVAWRP